MLRLSALVALGGFVCALTAPLEATVTLPASFRELVNDATLIVRGQATEVRAVRMPDGSTSSVATIAVDAVLKGQADRFVSVILPGGQIGRTRVIVVGAPRVRVRDAGVWLLTRGPDGVWRLVDLAMGLVRVHRDAASGQLVVAPPLVAGRTASAGPVVRGDVRRRPLSVGEFDALVRVILAPPRRPVRAVR